MKRIAAVSLLVLFLFGQSVQVTYACGFLEFACIFGVTEITNRDAVRRETEKKLDGEIQRDKNAALLQLENVRNARYASDNQRMIAIRTAELQYESYARQLDAWRSSMLKQFDAQIQAGHDQAAIAQTGIQEAGRTTRARLAWDGSYNIILVIVVGTVLILLMRRRTAAALQPVIMLMQSPQQLEWESYPDRQLADEQEWQVYGQPVEAVTQARALPGSQNELTDKRQYLARGR